MRELVSFHPENFFFNWIFSSFLSIPWIRQLICFSLSDLLKTIPPFCLPSWFEHTTLPIFGNVLPLYSFSSHHVPFFPIVVYFPTTSIKLWKTIDLVVTFCKSSKKRIKILSLLFLCSRPHNTDKLFSNLTFFYPSFLHFFLPFTVITQEMCLWLVHFGESGALVFCIPSILCFQPNHSPILSFFFSSIGLHSKHPPKKNPS